jgi:hypothetical protein
MDGHHQRGLAGKRDGADRTVTSILAAMENENPNLWLNWDVIAERWLDLIRPAWYAALSGRRKQARPLLLKDVRQDLLHGKPLELSEVLRALVPVPTLPPLDERLAACILGVRERAYHRVSQGTEFGPAF